ncbi:hypothetical protein NPIL_275011 [Nephila pilipes]|uniref:Uncharacterized protein n=1 Tax=Nephila pilipes TaxID=299642 RepID=A0A8X6PX02_NEPPI|nr:hypothetical protein NPIL_275011 [Nephila pilipes]
MSQTVCANQIFNDLEVSNNPVNENILKTSIKTYSIDEKSHAVLDGNDKSFNLSSSDYLEVQEKVIDSLISSEKTINEKNIASSSLSYKNDFILNGTSKFVDGNIHIDSERPLMNNVLSKRENNGSLFSLFDNEDDKCDTSDCGITNESDLSNFPCNSYQRTRKNLKNQIAEKRLNVNKPKNHQSSNKMIMKSVQTPIQPNFTSGNMSNKLGEFKLNGVKLKTQNSNSCIDTKFENNVNFIIDNEIFKPTISIYDPQYTLNFGNGLNLKNLFKKSKTCSESDKQDPQKKPSKYKTFIPEKMVTRATSNKLKNSTVKKIVSESAVEKKSNNKRNNLQKKEGTFSEKLISTSSQNKSNPKISPNQKIDSKSANVNKCNNKKNDCQKIIKKITKTSISSSIQFSNKASVKNGRGKKATKQCNEDEVMSLKSSEYVNCSSGPEEYKNTKRMKLNNGSFKQIKRTDILNRDEMSFRSSDQNQSVDSINKYDDSSYNILEECGVNLQNELNAAGELNVYFQELSDEMEHNCFLTIQKNYEGSFTKYSFEHASVKNFCNSAEVYKVLTNFFGMNHNYYHSSYENEKNHNEIESISFENFLNDSVSNVVHNYVQETISRMFSSEDLESQILSTKKIKNYAYKVMSSREWHAVGKLFPKNEFLKLETVVVKLTALAVLWMFNRFREYQ